MKHAQGQYAQSWYGAEGGFPDDELWVHTSEYQRRAMGFRRWDKRIQQIAHDVSQLHWARRQSGHPDHHAQKREKTDELYHALYRGQIAYAVLYIADYA